MSNSINWSHVKVERTADNVVTITFPDSIKDIVAPVERNGQIALEFLAAALTHGVATKHAPNHPPPPPLPHPLPW